MMRIRNTLLGTKRNSVKEKQKPRQRLLLPTCLERKPIYENNKENKINKY